LFDDEMASWDRVIGINFLGVLYGIKAFVPRLLEQGTHAHVLATSSGAGANGTMYSGAGYAVTKAAVVSLMECLYGQLRDKRAPIVTTVVLPPLARTNLAGDPANMEYVARGLAANQIPMALAEPEEVAQVVLDAIQHDRFWAHFDHHHDESIFGGRMSALIEWQNNIIRARADAIINRGAPDAYLWSGSPPAS
jgi:NAD(P)-dependent dehydrogenase (short-subunit alcohol dehydrogenase family)